MSNTCYYDTVESDEANNKITYLFCLIPCFKKLYDCMTKLKLSFMPILAIQNTI